MSNRTNNDREIAGKKECIRLKTMSHFPMRDRSELSYYLIRRQREERMLTGIASNVTERQISKPSSEGPTLARPWAGHLKWLQGLQW